MGRRSGARDPTALTTAAEAAEAPIEVVSTKSTTSAPRGTKAHPAPGRGRRDRGGAPAVREQPDDLLVVHHDERQDGDDDGHRPQQEVQAAVQGTQRRLDGVGDRGDGIGHDGEREGGDQEAEWPPVWSGPGR